MMVIKLTKFELIGAKLDWLLVFVYFILYVNEGI